MNVLAKPRVNVDEFLDPAIGRPGHHELLRGEVIAISPETAGHAEIKAAVYTALRAGILQQGPALSCTAGRHLSLALG